MRLQDSQALMAYALSTAKGIAADAEALRPPPPQPSAHAASSEYIKRVVDPDLRVATESRFDSRHYADAVEAGVKALCECVRKCSGRTEDGDALMTVVFSASAPLLRLNAGKSKTDDSEQRGHMMLCQGVVGAWRNPRAHSLVNDSPERALMMLEMINDLMAITKRAKRTRSRKPKP